MRADASRGLFYSGPPNPSTHPPTARCAGRRDFGVSQTRRFLWRSEKPPAEDGIEAPQGGEFAQDWQHYHAVFILAISLELCLGIDQAGCVDVAV